MRSLLRSILFLWESQIAPLIAIYLSWMFWPIYFVLKRNNICFVVNIAGGTGHIICEVDFFLRRLHSGKLDKSKRYIWIRKNDPFSSVFVRLYGHYFWFAKASYLLYELTLPLTIRFRDITLDSGLSGLLWQLDERGKYIRPIAGQNYLNLLPLNELTPLWNQYYQLKGETENYYPLITSKIKWKGLKALVGEEQQLRVLIHLKEKKANATALKTEPVSYFKTLEYFSKRQIQLVFVGREKMPGCFKKYGVIDYAGSYCANFENDIALFQSCYMAIVAGSGIAYLADAYRKPYIYINSWHLATPVFSPLAVIVPTLLKKKSGEFLTFQEQIDLFLTTQSDGTVADLTKYDGVNASEEDIYHAVLELEREMEHSEPLTDLQKKMSNLRLNTPLYYASSRYSQAFLKKYERLLEEGNEILTSCGSSL